MTELAPYALTTLDRLKKELDIPTDDTTQDDTLAAAINAASDAIRRHCRRDFARAELTERLTGRRTSALVLALTPVQRVDAIEVCGVDFPVEQVTVNAASGLLERHHGSVWPALPIDVAYVGGYVTPAQETPESPRDLPWDLEAACLLIAVGRVQAMGQPVDAQTLQVEQIRVNFGDGGRPGIPYQASNLLDPYVRWS